MHYPLFSDHLELAHQYWRSLLNPGDIAIDATCGNGHDSAFIASHIFTEDSGKLYLFDIQQDALNKTLARLSTQIGPRRMRRVHSFLSSHSQFPEIIKPASVTLIVYNLGYLPGGDKSITTRTETTLQSLRDATFLVKPGGLISITCYPGHQEGQHEETLILKWTETCDFRMWRCCHYRWTNRRKAPSLFLIQKCCEPYG